MLKKIEMPACNGRFGASGAVARPKVCAYLEVLRPSERQWKPRLRQAAGTLGVSGRQRSGNERNVGIGKTIVCDFEILKQCEQF